MASIQKFLENECGNLYSNIVYYIDDTTRKKVPTNEKNNRSLEEIRKQKTKPNFPTHKKYKKNAEGNWILENPLSENEEQSLTRAYSIYLKHIPDLYCIDVDEPHIKSMDDFVSNTKIDIFKDCFWIEGNTKGIHIYLKIKNLPSFTDQQKVYKDFDGDLIKNNNMWEKTTKLIHNYEIEQKDFEYEELKLLFNEKINKLEKTEYEGETDEESSSETEYTHEEENQQENNFKKFEKMAHLYKEQRIQEYESWRLWTIAIKESFGNKGKALWRKISELHGKKSQKNKPNGNFYEEANENIWDSLRTDKKKKITFGSLVKWAKDDNLEEYEKLFGKQIDWDIFTSEAGFAKTLKKVIFQNKSIIYVGKDRQPRGYMYNDVYWQELSLSENEIKQNNFDKLYKYYMDELMKHKFGFADEKLFNEYKTKIQTLNKRLTRENVMKLFVTDCYLPQEPNWNNNPDIYAFNDCLYSLKEKRVLEQAEINKEWYINHTCGYNYEDISICKEKVKVAKQNIKKIFEEILHHEDVEYVWKVCGSFLKQNNPEEKAYFWLGKGGNGKGTITELLKAALGDYWGELEMTNYTEKDNGKNAPNQNLFNNKYSRVLNSTETDDNGEKTERFRADFFKKITGSDDILARALGKSEIVKFKAGKIIIQANKLPGFTVIDIALKRRIIVINFPYCFTDDKNKIKENPTKYKASNSNLKVMFKQPEYKIAMIELLFQNYEDEYIEVPENVRKYTNSYFEEESVVSWVQENYRLATEEEIDDHKLKNPRTLPSIMINTIKYEYERETGKKLSIKTIATQLIDEGFDIKGGNSSKALNGYVCNDPETIYE